MNAGDLVWCNDNECGIYGPAILIWRMFDGLFVGLFAGTQYIVPVDSLRIIATAAELKKLATTNKGG